MSLVSHIIKAKFKLFAAFFILIALVRIYDVASKISLTVDEPQHLLTGMELIQFDHYTLENLHPPLTRLLVAAPLYFFKGIRIDKNLYNYKIDPLSWYSKFMAYTLFSYGRFRVDYGVSLLGNNELEFRENLLLIRLPTMLFFVFGGVFLFLLAKLVYKSESVAACTIFFYSTLPIILSNASLATTDMGCVATVIFGMYSGILWLQRPIWRISALFGFSIGLIAATKYSGIPWLLIAASSVLIAKDFTERKISKGYKWRWIKQIAFVFFISFFVVWATYFFSIGYLGDKHYIFHKIIHDFIDIINKSDAASVIKSENAIRNFIIPMPEFWDGFFELLLRNNQHFVGYIFGKFQFEHGAWFFFPVATLFKMPIAFLVLVLVGMIYSIKDYMKTRNWLILWIPITVVFSYFFVMLASNINIGIRHILPTLVLLCLFAGYFLNICISNICTSFSGDVILDKSKAWLGIIILVPYLYSSISSHPNYIGYFNIFAYPYPERILSDNDFDMGQDIYDALHELENRGIIDQTVIIVPNIHPFNAANMYNIHNYSNGLSYYNSAINKPNSDVKYLLVSIWMYQIRLLLDTSKYNYLKEKDCKIPPTRIANTFFLFEGEICSWQ